MLMMVVCSGSFDVVVVAGVGPSSSWYCQFGFLVDAFNESVPPRSPQVLPSAFCSSFFQSS
jgi:hypothetical protein